MKRTALATHTAEQITRRVEVAFSDDPDDTLHATVNVMGLTPELVDTITGGQVKGLDEARMVFARALHELVVEWDMVEDDGTPTSLAVDDLQRWALSDLATLVFRLVEVVRGVPFGTSTPSAE